MSALEKLFDYQREALDFHIKKKYSLNAFQMGIGKSITALALIEKVKEKAVIISPAFLVKNWQDEIEKFCPELKDKIKIISYSQIHKEDLKQDAGVIVADEFHYAKSRSARRSKAVYDMVKKTKPQYFLGLSGTPVKNFLHEFYMLLKIINIGENLPSFEEYQRSFWKFAHQFCQVQERFVYGRKILEFGGAKNVDELKTILADCMVRKKASDVLDLPESISKNFIIKDKAKTDAALKRAYEIFDSGKVVGQESFTETKTINALSKVEFTVSLAKEILEEENHLIIFTDHVDSSEAIAKELCGVSITGKIKPSDRITIINNWKRVGGVLVGTFGAMGTGLNLIEAKYMIVNDFPWVGSDLLQALKRIMRIGQTETVFYYYVFSSDVDHYIYEKVLGKSKALKEVL